MDAIARITRSEQTAITGVCSGGVIAAMVAAHLAHTGRQDRIAALTLMVAPDGQHHRQPHCTVADHVTEVPGPIPALTAQWWPVASTSDTVAVVSVAQWVAANPEAGPTLTRTVLATQGQYRLTCSSISTSYWARLQSGLPLRLGFMIGASGVLGPRLTLGVFRRRYARLPRRPRRAARRHGPPAAQMTRIIALTALVALGLSGASVHDPVHACSSYVLPSCYRA